MALTNVYTSIPDLVASSATLANSEKEILEKYYSIIEHYLQPYRDMCKTDGEFESRVFGYSIEGKIKITQYLFDNEPIFYVEIDYKEGENRIMLGVAKGEYHE